MLSAVTTPSSTIIEYLKKEEEEEEEKEKEEEEEEVMEDMVEVVQFVTQGYHFCRTLCLGSILTVRGRHDVLCFLSSMHVTYYTSPVPRPSQSLGMRCF